MLKEIRDWIVCIGGAFLFYLIITTFVASPFKVSGKSMDYTYENNDRVFITKVSTYERGDVVVFKVNDKENYIKRVIGVPGDTVEMIDDILYVNGKKIDEPYLEKKKQELTESNLTEDFNIKTLESTKSAKVPEDTFFVMGDNRQNSMDSRELGFITKNAIIGEVFVRYYPFKSFGFM